MRYSHNTKINTKCRHGPFSEATIGKQTNKEREREYKAEAAVKSKSQGDTLT